MSNKPGRPRRKPSRDTAKPGIGKNKDGVFWFEHPPGSGQKHPLPQPRFGALRNAAKQGGEFEQVTYLLEHTAGPETLAVLDDMSVEAVFRAWHRALGGSLGDTSPSPGS